MLQRIIDNISWLFFDKIVRLGMGLVVGIWVARYLGPEQYGLLNFGVATVALFSIFVKLGLKSIVVRDLVNTPERTGVTIGTAVVMQFVGAVIAYMLLASLVVYLRPEDALARTVVLLLGLTLFVHAFDTAKYWFEAKVISKYLVWMSNTVFLILSGIRVVLILAGAPLLHFVWVTVADAVIVGLCSVALFLKMGPGRLVLSVNKTRARELLTDSWPLFLAGAAIAVYMKVDMVMLAQLAGDDAVGIYTAATKVSDLWFFIPSIIVASVFPSLINARNAGDEIYISRLQDLFTLLIWIAVTGSVILSVSAPIIIDLLFGSAFSNAIPVLQIHVWSSVFVFYGVAWSKWALLEGYSGKILYLHISALIVNVILNLMLIERYGAQGAAVATLVSYGIGHTILVWVNPLFRPTARMFFKALFLR